MSSSNRFPWRQTNLVWFGWLAILLPWHMITPLLGSIRQELQVSSTLAGWLMGGFSLPYAAMQLPAGFLSDRWGIERPMLISVAGCTLISFLILFADSYCQLLLLRIAAGLFAGLWYAASTSFLLASCHQQNRGRALGLALMALPAARLVLFAAVGTLDEMITNWRFFFGIAAVPGLACAILLMYQARRRSGSVPPKGATKRYDEGFRALIRIRSLYPVFAFALLWQLLYFVLATFLPSYDLVQRGLPVASTSLLFILNSLAMIFCGLLAGLLYDRFGFLLPMLGYSALAAAASFVMPHVAPMVPLAAVYVAWGLFGSPLAAGAVVGAHIAKIVPGHLRGIALGTGNMIAFLGASAGPVIFGWVIDKSGYGLFFVLVGSLYLVAALLSVAVGAKGRRRPRRAALH